MSEKNIQRVLVLITKFFPFNRGNVPAESYLESEIPILAKIFNDIYIFAVDAPKDRQLCQDLPQGASAYALGVATDKWAKLRFAAASIFPVKAANRETYKLIRSSEKSLNSIGRLMGFRYSFNKAEAYRNAIVETIEREKLSIEGGLFYSFWMFDVALTALELAKSYNGSSVSRAHRYDLYEDQNRLGYLPFRRYLGDNLDAIAPCSKDGVCHLVEVEAFEPEKILLSYLGTRDLGFVPCVRNDDYPLVISCSTLTPVKRVSLIADALNILDREGLRLRWRHYGSGPEADALQAKMSALSVIDAKLMGFVDHEKMLEAYRADPPALFINVSSSEGVPISIMEALSLGTPVICTNVGGSSEIVSSRNGILLDANPSSVDVASAIRLFLTLDGQTHQKLRAESRFVWETKLDVSKNVKELFCKL